MNERMDYNKNNNAAANNTKYFNNTNLFSIIINKDLVKTSILHTQSKYFLHLKALNCLY